MLINKGKRRFLQRIKRTKRQIRINNEKIDILSNKCMSNHCRAHTLIKEYELENHKLEMNLLFLTTQYASRKNLNEWD